MTEPLDRLLDEVAAQGWELNKPAEPSALDRLDAWWLARTGTPLADAHRDLLARTDGLDFNGCVLYATQDGRTPGGLFVAGLVESNERLGETAATWLGEANGDLFGLVGGVWLTADKVSRREYERHDDCAALLSTILHRYLET
ncbi:hypothetical protein [Actinophytocola xanthii]|uniref:Uncharacterized protein n=1 Tax=Actinophytocola xanthii TaxID=1912961 RepID=A0A1Q8CMK7_9PSEU|nr:hypothetical protein [Actinophytocola xanthii]OLF15574.1 hypothetical protein BU204_20865 [Actinophytocola xanthii]